MLTERRKERGERLAFRLLRAFLPFQQAQFIRILMPLAGKVGQGLAESIRVLLPGFLPIAVAEQDIGSGKGLDQLGGLFLHRRLFLLMPAGDELLLADDLLAGGFAVRQFFMQAEQLLLKAGQFAGTDRISLLLLG